MGTDLAIIGIGGVFTMYRPFMEGIWKFFVDEKVLSSFDESPTQTIARIRDIFNTALNNKFSFFSGIIWIIFILWRVSVHYPYPIPGFSEYPYALRPYNLLDVYSLAIFLFVMLILGTGIWNIIAISVKFLRARLRLIPSEINNLKGLQKYFIIALVAWYFSTFISMPVLVIFSPSTDIFIQKRFAYINPISDVQIFMGILLFLVPNYQIHRFAETVKREELKKARKIINIRSLKRSTLLKLLEDEVSEEQIKNLASDLNLYYNIVDIIESQKTWLFDVPSIIYFIISVLISVFLTLLFQGTFSLILKV